MTVHSNVPGVDGERVLAEAVDAYRVALGRRLVAAYALGSLAHGGFSELVSDVDLGLIITDPPRAGDAAMVEEVADAQKRGGSPLHERLSVFWGTPSTLAGARDGGRFSALDRLDLIEHGRLLAGSDDVRPDLKRPHRDELIVGGVEFALEHLAGLRPAAESSSLGSMGAGGDVAMREILCPDLLVRRGVRRITKLVLFPVRFLHTAHTGHAGTNEGAVAHYLGRPVAPCARLVQAALRWRTEPPTDEALAIDLLGEQLVPLYLEYIDDHIPRLARLGRDDLAEALGRWRARLVT